MTLRAWIRTTLAMGAQQLSSNVPTGSNPAPGTEGKCVIVKYYRVEVVYCTYKFGFGL